MKSTVFPVQLRLAEVTCSLQYKEESPAAAQTHPSEQEMAPQGMNAPLSKVAP